MKDSQSSDSYSEWVSILFTMSVISSLSIFGYYGSDSVLFLFVMGALILFVCLPVFPILSLAEQGC